MDENNVSEGDNKRRQSDFKQDSNMSDGPESAKLLKTDNGSVGITITTSSEGSIELDCISNVRNYPLISTAECDVGISTTEIIEDDCPSSPRSTMSAPEIVSLLTGLTNSASGGGNNMFALYENRSLSTTFMSDDETTRRAASFDDEEDTYENDEQPLALQKAKPLHNWFILPEIINRQYGYTPKSKGSELFQKHCYGSLLCAQRLNLQYKLDHHRGCVNSLNFNPSGTLLASASDDLNVIVWDWKVGKPLLRYDTNHRSNVLHSKFLDLNGDLQIATCARDGQVRLSQVSVQEGLRINRKLGSHKGSCNKLATLCGQPHIILSAGEDGIVNLHDIRDYETDKLVNVLKDNGRIVSLYSISSHPLNPYEFCVSGRDTDVRSYDQRMCGEGAKPINVYYPKNQPDPSNELTSLHVTCAVYNHNGSEILATFNDDDIYLFDVNGEPGTFVHKYQGHRNAATVKGVNFFGPKSEFIISGSDCGNLFIWEKNTEAIVNWMTADDNGVTNCLEPHPQLPYLCTSGLDWDIKIWMPCCESEPLMTNLSKTVRLNLKSRAEQFKDGVGENRILWMLFRHFRNQHNSLSYTDEQSTHSSSSSAESDSDDIEEEVTGCNPS